MEQIIHHVEEFLEKVFTVHAYNITDLDATASELKKDSDELSRKILQTIIEEMNQSLREDKATRKEMGLVMKEKDRKRCILTELGEIHFNRDYYYNKNSDRYEAPIDQMLSIEARARIGAEICSKLVTKATEESYARSAKDVTGGLVSRQSVKNAIMKAPELEKQPEDEDPKQVRTLDVYADEDHVHLQKPEKEKGKRNKLVPLVTVTEGTKKISNTRNATINPVHFVDENMNSKNLWSSVEGYIGKTYDLDTLEEIRLHSDGGPWIKTGLENFINVVRVLDLWHLYDRIRTVDNTFPCRQAGNGILKALKDNDRDRAETILAGLISQCAERKEFKTLRDFQTYIFSNWDAAINSLREGMTGSCTEGQVSHVLSERFSRNPMGWSVKGVGKLSKLRVFCKNGGEIKAEHFKSSYEENENLKDYASRIMEEQIGKYDLRWLSDMRETYVFDTTSGTQQEIKHLGRMRDNFIN